MKTQILTDNIIIHTCNSREKYVREILVPSLVDQGIDEGSIFVWQDYFEIGNLQSFLSCADWVSGTLERTSASWHLQDDVCVSKHFKKTIEKYNQGIVCGFCCKTFNPRHIVKFGRVPARNMWFSFPCIRIPNSYLKEFLDWMQGQDILENERYRKWYEEGKNDDVFFYQFIKRYHNREYVINLNPNIVEHIDYLIGGSQVNVERIADSRAFYWGEDQVVKELEEKLGGLDK